MIIRCPTACQRHTILSALPSPMERPTVFQRLATSCLHYHCSVQHTTACQRHTIQSALPHLDGACNCVPTARHLMSALSQFNTAHKLHPICIAQPDGAHNSVPAARHPINPSQLRCVGRKVQGEAPLCGDTDAQPCCVGRIVQRKKKKQHNKQ